jgi:hypothetical protein
MHAEDARDGTWLLVAIVELIGQEPGLGAAEIHRALVARGHGDLTADEVRRAHRLVRWLGLDRRLFIERLTDGQKLLLGRPDETRN